MNGAELLTEFRQRRSEPAFEELVRRYTDLVVSVAKRRLNNEALAQEAAQSVFLRLAGAAPKLPSEPALLGWLHRTTVHVSIDLWRAETRRRAREEKAAAMQLIEVNENTHLPTEVDEALNELSEPDRVALLLRFFDGKKMRELGESLGITEDAAKMRVGRALDRLRDRLALRGIQSTTVLLAALLTEQAINATPAGLAQAIAATSFEFGSRISSLEFIGRTLKSKYAALLGVGLIGLVSVTILSLRLKDSLSSKSDLQQSGSTTAEANAAPGATLETGATEETLPDPRQLLEGVARARNRILSGSMELEAVSVYPIDGTPQTNAVQIRALFDGNKRRFEQLGFEYHYVGVGEEGERAAQIIRDRKMPRTEAIRAGLLEEFESHHVSAYDGTAMLKYWETDGKSAGTTIDDPSKGSVEYLFDPRCLGLRTFITGTLETGMSLTCADDVTLTGQEIIEGTPSWHIEVSCRGNKREYWVSVAQPERLLKQAEFGEVLASRYAPNNPRDPVPIEVITTSSRNTGHISRITRGRTDYNIVVDPSFCTLAGLGMQRGATVTDVRAQRSLGYWTGQGLSEELPSEKDVEPAVESTTLADQFYTLEKQPESDPGFEAATWIVLNTPDGPEVEKAAEAILEHHLQNTNLLGVAARLETLRHRSSKPLLKAILASSPAAEIRGTACFSLAVTFKDEAEFGANKPATAESKTYFRRFISDFSTAGKQSRHKVAQSRRALEEIDTLFIGHKVPELTTTTLSGEPFDLAHYRGRAVCAIFRSRGYSEAEEHKKAFQKLADKPVSFVGVYCDDQPAQALAAVEAEQLDWPTIWDGKHGPIAARWHINSWISTFLIDKTGTIRHRNLRWTQEIEAALAKLASE